MEINNIIKKQTTIIALSVIGMCIIVISTSYALFMRVDTSTKNNIVENGTLTTEYASGTTLTTSALPQSDTEGLATDGYSFSVTNTGSLPMKYEITIYNDSDVDLTNAISQDYLRLSLDGGTPVTMSTLTKTSDTASLTDQNSIKYILATNLVVNISGKTGDVKTHNVKIWIDENSPESIIGKTVSLEVSVNGSVTEDMDMSGASVPELYQGMIPVTYDASGNVIVADNRQEWYNYSSHNWANAVLVNCADTTIKNKYFNSDMTLKSSVIGNIIPMDEILQMYVWIPRYKYLLWNAENGSSDEQAITIVFESNTTAKSTGTTNGTYLTHPAFTFGDTELNGIWVGKFETSGTTTGLTIKPNVAALTSTTVGDMFNAIRNLELTYSVNYGIDNTSIDSHMMKNMEWGAVGYLSNSIYGRYNDASTCIASGCETWINNNSGYITGCAGATVSASSDTTNTTSCASGYDWTTLGVNASTTGNIYGIYDMSGGAYEYVMGNMVDSTGAFYPSSSGLTQPDTKYYDSYTYGTSAKDHARGKLGDATKETLKTFGNVSGGWNGDYANFPNNTSSWFTRGGYYGNGSGAGVFDFNRSGTDVLSTGSFRSVLTAE